MGYFGLLFWPKIGCKKGKGLDLRDEAFPHGTLLSSTREGRLVKVFRRSQVLVSFCCCFLLCFVFIFVVVVVFFCKYFECFGLENQ